jgi:hypothetical protein
MKTDTTTIHSPEATIAQALFDYSGSGQGCDDMLADIALSQAKEIMKALKEQGFTVFRGMQQ